MAGAMRKMAVYLGLVEDDGYDGRGFDPDDDFEPELDPEPERDHRRHEPAHQSHGSHQPQRDEELTRLLNAQTDAIKALTIKVNRLEQRLNKIENKRRQ